MGVGAVGGGRRRGSNEIGGGAEWFEVNKVLLVKRTWLKGGGEGYKQK